MPIYYFTQYKLALNVQAYDMIEMKKRKKKKKRFIYKKKNVRVSAL